MLNTLLIVLFASQVQAKTVQIAVIDTGLRDDVFSTGIGICKTGHKDFTGEGLNDTHGHGTNVSGLIHFSAKIVDYCQVILKYYKSKPDPQCVQRLIDNLITKKYPVPMQPLMTFLMKETIREVAAEKCANDNSKNMTDAIKYAVALGVDYINISGGGPNTIVDEWNAILSALNKGITVVAAAGNEGQDIDINPYYPAMYDERIMVVGNVHHSRIHPTSNYGKSVDVFEDGVGQTAHGITLSGTSQATAIHAGKMISKNERVVRKYEPRKRKSFNRALRVPHKKP